MNTRLRPGPRPTALLAVVLVVLGIVLALSHDDAGAAARSASAYKKCSGGYNPDGSKGAFYRKIRVKKITCKTGRSVTKAWVVAHSSGSTDPAKKSVVKGYTCKGKSTASATDPEGGLSVRCVKHGKAVRFYGHP